MAKGFEKVLLETASSMSLFMADALIDSILLLRPTLRRLGLERKLNAFFGVAEESVDARILKIDAARENLSEALVAMDELKKSAEDNRQELQRMQAALAKAEAEKDNLSSYNQDLRKMGELEAESLRKALGMPTPREVLRGKVASFIAGVLMTLVLSLLYDFAIKPSFL